MSVHSCAGSVVALFPGSRAWVEEKEPGTHCACSVPPGFLGLKISVISVTLTSARYVDFPHIKKCLSLTALCVDNDKGATRVLSSSLSMHLWIPAKHCSTWLWIPAKHCSTWLTQSLPLKFTDHFERSRLLPSKGYYFKNRSHESQKEYMYNHAVQPFSR